MTRRAQILALLRVAGYHNDRRQWMRFYVGGRVSLFNAQRAWDDGSRWRNAGVKCTCRDCADSASVVQS